MSAPAGCEIVANRGSYATCLYYNPFGILEQSGFTMKIGKLWTISEMTNEAQYFPYKHDVWPLLHEVFIGSAKYICHNGMCLLYNGDKSELDYSARVKTAVQYPTTTNQPSVQPSINDEAPDGVVTDQIAEFVPQIVDYLKNELSTENAIVTLLILLLLVAILSCLGFVSYYFSDKDKWRRRKTWAINGLTYVIRELRRLRVVRVNPIDTVEEGVQSTMESVGESTHSKLVEGASDAKWSEEPTAGSNQTEAKTIWTSTPNSTHNERQTTPPHSPINMRRAMQPPVSYEEHLSRSTPQNPNATFGADKLDLAPKKKPQSTPPNDGLSPNTVLHGKIRARHFMNPVFEDELPDNLSFNESVDLQPHPAAAAALLPIENEEQNCQELEMKTPKINSAEKDKKLAEIRASNFINMFKPIDKGEGQINKTVRVSRESENDVDVVNPLSGGDSSVGKVDNANEFANSVSDAQGKNNESLDEQSGDGAELSIASNNSIYTLPNSRSTLEINDYGGDDDETPSITLSMISTDDYETPSLSQ